MKPKAIKSADLSGVKGKSRNATATGDLLEEFLQFKCNFNFL